MREWVSEELLSQRFVLGRSLWQRVLGLLVLCAVLCASASCVHFKITTPPSFAELPYQAPRFDYRAVTAYGVAISVRVVSNEGNGTLDFWTEAVDRSLRRSGPYRPDGMLDANTVNGVRGKRLQYAYGEAPNASTYWVTVFVTPQRVYIVEAGGAVEAFTRAKAEVERALQSFSAS